MDGLTLPTLHARRACGRGGRQGRGRRWGVSSDVRVMVAMGTHALSKQKDACFTCFARCPACCER